MNNIIYDYIYIIIIFYILYIIYQDYIYHIENKDRFILCVDDFENNLDKYANSELYTKLNNLSDIDKNFLNDYIVYTMIKYKTNKPQISKKISTLKYDIIIPSIISNVHNIAILPIILAFKQNILQHFTTKIF